MAEISEKAVERAARAWARISEAYQAARAVVDDDRRGWLICACVLIVTVVRSGITYSFGMFVVDFEKLYHKPLAEQSETTPQTATKKTQDLLKLTFAFSDWIGTLSFCISLSMAPVSVAFIRSLKYRGYRWGGIGGLKTWHASVLNIFKIILFFQELLSCR